MVLIAFRAQRGSAGRDEACEISTPTLLSGLETHGPCKIAHRLLRHGQSRILHGLLPHYMGKNCSMTPIPTPLWHPC